jgi:hypothetical protein
MIFDELVHSYMASAPALAQKNTEDFLSEYSINRAAFEEFAFRSFKFNYTPFYVSTVPRGMAGSTSDLDVILVSDVTSNITAITHHLFYQGRRIGLKFIHGVELDKTFDLAEEFSNLPISDWFLSIDKYEKQLSIKWEDFERLVNGVSFDVGTPYICHLPNLCQWSLLNFLLEYHEQRFMATLAYRASELYCAHGYIVYAIIAAMDAIMAACGQIQWNCKWTLERWSRFKSTITDSKVKEGILIINSLEGCLESCHYSPETVLNKLEELSSYFCNVFAPLEDDKLFLNISGEVQKHQFISSAISLTSPQRTAIISSDTLSEIINTNADDIINLDQYIASLSLKLLQLDILSLNRLTCH